MGLYYGIRVGLYYGIRVGLYSHYIISESQIDSRDSLASEPSILYTYTVYGGHVILSRSECPQCKMCYVKARGGCMHYKCVYCTHDFCGECGEPMKNGAVS